MLTIGYVCPPDAVPLHLQAQPQEAYVPGRRTLLQPYASPADLRNDDGLGLVLPMPEITRSLGPGAGPWFDSEDWMYPDTALGAIPTDDEIAVARGSCSTPVHSGWVTGLGDAMGQTNEALGQTNDALAELAAHQKRMFWLSILSTTAIATLAAVSLYTLLKE